MKLYEGLRAAGAGPATVTVRQGPGWRDHRPLDPRFDLRRHSPAGFQWSYEGSGPAQLALALLADALGDDVLAQQLYQRFKRERLAPLRQDHFTMTDAEIIAWADARKDDE